MYGPDKISLSANFYSPGMILVIFDPNAAHQTSLAEDEGIDIRT